jgi:hypothetical protein
MPQSSLPFPLCFTRSSKEVKPMANSFSKVENCLYRYSNGTYYTIAKRKGKIVRKTLETSHLQIARRKLRDFLRELDSVDPGTGNVSIYPEGSSTN